MKVGQCIATVRQTMRIGFVCLAAFVSSCGPHGASKAEDSAVADGHDALSVSGHDITEDARLWADSIMDRMTIEEMAGQLIMPAVYADAGRQGLRLVSEYAADWHVGGVVLLKGTVAGARAVSDILRSMLDVPPFIAIDAEWGLAMRLADTPEFPRNGRISADADEVVMYDYGREMGRECREVGVNMLLGPVLDVLPAEGRGHGIGSRSFGREAERAASLGVAYAKGVESWGVISVAKHFPGHGSADADSHRRLPEVAKTKEQLEASDLIPFRQYISNGLSAIMTGHLFVPALEEDSIPVTVSEKILKRFVRDELGFTGLIVTDAINMAGAAGYSAADAISAGADIVLAPADTEEALWSIVEAVRNGRISAATLRDRTGRVLFYKYMSARECEDSGIKTEPDEAERIIKLLR